MLAALLCATLAQSPDAPSPGNVDHPLAVSILSENSVYLAARRALMVAAIRDFVDHLGPQDVAEVVEFSSGIKIRQRFTTDRTKLGSALETRASPSGRAIYAAIRQSLRDLVTLGSTHQCADCKLAMVVFAGGNDISSVITARQLVAIVAKSRDVVIYTIGISSKGGQLEPETDWVLREMANSTGGRAFFPTRFEDLPSVYTAIRESLYR